MPADGRHGAPADVPGRPARQRRRLERGRPARSSTPARPSTRCAARTGSGRSTARAACPRRLPCGPASAISRGPSGGIVLGRNTADPARWKRYRGGTAGDLWVDPTATASSAGWSRSTATWPARAGSGDRIYFLSDHEGVGNVYSCRRTASDVRRHTDHDDYYARNLSSDGQRLVYHAGGELTCSTRREDESRQLDVQLGSSRTQRNRRFVPAGKFLHERHAQPGRQPAWRITTRGKAFTFDNWEGAGPPARRAGRRALPPADLAERPQAPGRGRQRRRASARC